jgi:hypothetical protein
VAPDGIGSIEIGAACIEAQYGHSKFVSAVLSGWEHSPGNEDQRVTSIRGGNASNAFDHLGVHIVLSIFDPREEPAAVQIECIACLIRACDSVKRAEIDHPLTADFDCFGKRCSPWQRKWRLSMHCPSFPPTSHKRMMIDRDVYAMGFNHSFATDMV